MDTKKLRQKILELAIHGKLVPQDPNDEPASVLLERIKEEKERLIKEGKIKRSKKTAKTSDTPHYENVPFEVPKGWVWCMLQDITKIIGDGLHGTPEYDSNGEYYFINGNNLYNRKIIIKGETKRVSILEYKKYRKPLDDTTVLISINGTIGNVGIYNGEKIMLGKSACYINLCQQINKQYICNILESNLFLKYAIESATGSTIKNVPLKAINEFLLPLPPFAEQQRVVTEIEHWFALIDMIGHGKADLQTIIKQTKSKILDLAIHGKVVPQDPNDEPASELLKRINPKAEITCDNAHYQNLPFNIPSEWAWTTLGQIGKWQSGSTPNRLNKDYYGGSIPWLKTGDLNDDYITYIPESITEKALNETPVKLNPKGSVLIAMYGATIGKIGILTYPATTNQACCACDVFHGIEKEYLFYFLLSHREKFVKLGGGGAQPNISKEKITNTYIPIPPHSEQKRIVATIHKVFAKLDAMMESL